MLRLAQCARLDKSKFTPPPPHVAASSYETYFSYFALTFLNLRQFANKMNACRFKETLVKRILQLLTRGH